MSTPSDPQSPEPTDGPRQPTTQEIPVVVPPATGATSVQQLPPPSSPAPAPEPSEARSTGPVDFVPGLPGLGTPPPPPAAASWPQTLENDAAPAAAARTRAPRDRTLLAAAGLVVASLVLLELGLALEFGTESFWSALPLWSAFATLCAVLGLAAAAALLPAGRRLGGAGWGIAAGGLVGLAVFWVLVVLPNADSDRGFLLTAALGALGGALWLTAGRRTS
ncbi:hypothetical protein DQ237_16885 [Blastococcus sp. TF02-8]|uniref:hypothetical protein n=1 Tax=Blastococcus sp. TF02-8 TaxID=2250574 RepID=UPI000DE8D875|nr:hypothetical protein [Blastococcus sp. TF02-8]RBY93652.1 hypothetical protein DQ237_16885 [Blastococcus sp. TF02-8]